MPLFRPTGPSVTLETERFMLESLSRGKIARASFPWTRIPEVMTAYGEKPNPTFREWRHLTPRTDNRRRFCFAIRPRSSSEIIGFERVIVDRDRNGLLTVLIGDRSWWGKGVVAETRRAVIGFCFETLKCPRVVGAPTANNYPSIANYQALGFRAEGILRQQRINHAGAGRLDVIVFGLLAEEWQKGGAGRS
jgi:RimJ/RimL family protein N-acetyltransferase